MADKKTIIFDDVLKDLLQWVKHFPQEFLIIGGIAVSLLTRPRTTQDVDVLSLLDESQWEDFLKAGQRFGFEARIKEALSFAQRNRVLLLGLDAISVVPTTQAGGQSETERGETLRTMPPNSAVEAELEKLLQQDRARRGENAS